MAHTIAAYSGGTLPAAIGIIRISGAHALHVFESLFRRKSERPLDQCTPGKLYMGTLLSTGNHAIDLCMGTFMSGPRSYTGEDMCEIYCHGSAAIVSAALEHSFELGCRPAQAGEFTQRAFLNGKLDLIEAEAVADLIESNSVLSARAAVNQLQGAVSAHIYPVRTSISDLLVHFYAVCDYPDEDLDPFQVQQAAQTLEQQALCLEKLLQSYEKGKILQQGVPVAIIGRPNVGKSTLFNALAGFSRAIVTEEAGTTRDVIDQVISCGGAPVRIFDTAGIRAPQGKAEEMGIEKARQTLFSASAAIWVVEGTLQEEDLDAHALALQVPRRALIINKTDLGKAPEIPEEIKGAYDHIFAVSALENTGLEPLIGWLGGLVPQPDKEVMITSARQAALLGMAAADLRRAAESCTQGMTADAFLSDAERALQALGEITGETASPDIAGEIFSRFCVGK